MIKRADAIWKKGSATAPAYWPPKCNADQTNYRDYQPVRDGRRLPQKRCLGYGAPDGDNEGRHHGPGSKPCKTPSTRALGSSSQPATAPGCSGSVKEPMAGNPQRYFVIALNSPRCSRAKGPTACSRQFSMWSRISVFLACALAFSTACNCWAPSSHGRCVSIMPMMLRKCPSRRRRLTISGCLWWIGCPLTILSPKMAVR